MLKEKKEEETNSHRMSGTNFHLANRAAYVLAGMCENSFKEQIQNKHLSPKSMGKPRSKLYARTV